MPADGAPVPVPRSLLGVSAVVLLAGVALMLLGAVRVGVTYDEPLHVQRFNNYLATGWYLGDGQVVDGEPTEDMRQQYVYAPVTMLLLHGAAVVAGVEEQGAASTSAEAYRVRHLGIVGISLLGLAAIAATARLLLRRWEWGVVAAATLVAVPLWTGHSMFNVKDVSVATGYALVTLGLAVIGRPERDARRLVRLGGPAALAVGIFLAVGTRPGIWVGVATGGAVLVGARLLRRSTDGFAARLRADAWRYRDLALATVVPYLGLLAVYPQVFGSPFSALVRSALGSASFLPVDASWAFVPLRVGFQMPLGILCLVVIGTVSSVRRVVADRGDPNARYALLGLVLAQMLVLPLVAIIHGASLYGDLRQVLFAAPATALVATVGTASLVRVVEGRRTVDPTGPRLVAALAGIALALPLLAQGVAFPYGYTYYNPLAKVAGLTIQGDYYRAGGRELAPDLPVSGRIFCTPEIDASGNAMRVGHLDGWVDCTDPASSPVAAYAAERRRSPGKLDDDEFWAVTFDSRGRVPKNCESVSSVSRRLVLRRLYLSTLSLCRRPFPILGSGPLAFSAESADAYPVPDRGWRAFGVDGTTAGLGFRGGPGTLRFGLEPKLVDGNVALELRFSAPVAVAVSFGGTPLNEARPPEMSVVRLRLPHELVERAVVDPLVLEILPVEDGGAGVKLMAMELTTR